jgi:energy-coupling factor transporter transmembrane protein EcfT
MVGPTPLNARPWPWLASADPRLKLAALGWFSLVCVMVDSTAALGVVFLLAALVVAGVRLSWRGWLAAAGTLALVAWSTVLGQALFYEQAPRTVLLTLLPSADLGGWHFSGLTFYREGAAHGLAQSLRMLSLMLIGLAVSLSTSPERLLAALARLRLNPAVGFVTVTALRFVPTLAAEWATVRQAQRLRGYRFRSGKPGGWMWRWPKAVRHELASLGPALAASLRRASSLATSVTARGFDPAGRRTFYPPLRFRTWERAALVLLGASVAAIAAAKALYGLYLGEMLYHPALRGLYDFVREWL